MVFIGAAEPSTLASAIRVPETYPADGDAPPFNPKEVVRIRTNAKFDDYYEIYGEPLGEGKFGKVFQCRERSTGLELAAKFIKIRKDADKTTVEREVSIMTQMRHPRIAQIYDAFYAGTNDVILLMEIVRGGELFNRVAEESYILTEKAVAMIVCQICEAIDYIHSQHIIHLDIKPENIMCVSENGNRIKLIDFGLAQYYDGSKDLYYMAGTPEFAAPEVIKYEPLDFRTDMWSVGVITYILLSGYSPFLGDNVAETYVNVERGEWEFTEEFELVSETAKDFIRNLLSYDKNHRMYPKECLKHPWIAETRASASIDTLLEQNTLDEESTQLSNKQLKKYVIRRRFRKLGFAVMCYVDFTRILRELRRQHSIKGEEFFAAAKIPDAPTMGTLLAKKSREEEKASPCDPSTSEKKDPHTSDEGAESGEKIVKKKKKSSTTTSSGGVERPKTKKAKKDVEESSILSPSEDDSRDKSKKRQKKDATSMATSSQEKPAKLVRKSSSEEKIPKRRVSKSPSPSHAVIPEDAKPKKKSVKPASSDSGVVADSKRRQSSMDRESVVSRKSEMTLSPPESIPETTKKVKKIKKATSTAAVPSESDAVPTQSNKDGVKAEKKKSTGTMREKAARAESSPLKMPTISIQPPTPATKEGVEKKKGDRSASPLTIKIPSSSSSSISSPLSNAPTSGISSPSTETLQVDAHRKKSLAKAEEDKQKKRVWKQEKYTANEAGESRRSTEVISVPKNQLPSNVDAEKAAAVKKRAQASPLAERIARMENMAKEKEKVQEERKGRLKVEREPSGMKKEPPPARISMVTEKAATTTKTTTLTTKNKMEEKEVGSSVTSSKAKIDIRDKTEKETQAVKLLQTEVKEERSPAEETPKKTVKKTVVKKTLTSTTTEKEKKIKGRSESIESSVSTVAKSDKNEVEFAAKLVSNGSTVEDGEVKIGIEMKKKLKVSKGDEKEKNKMEATEKEVTSVQVRKVPKEPKEPSPPAIEYPAGLADDIQRLKDARAKAKRREEEIQQRHVRFADETLSAQETKPEPAAVKVVRSTKIEHSQSQSEDDRMGGEEKKTRRKSSFFDITEEEKSKLESSREDFSFANLRQRLEKQLSKKAPEDSDEESVAAEPKKDVIVCPSTNSLLKKWKNIEQSNT